MSAAGTSRRHRVALIGASGRMGTRLIRLLQEHPQLELGAAVERPERAPSIIDAGLLAGTGTIGVALSTDLATSLSGVDVVIDFSAPPACVEVAERCVAAGVPYVVASTGLSRGDEIALDDAASAIPVLQAANLSVGVNVMLELVTLAAARLGAAFDVEIAELHHRMKRDAPSGTALALGRAVERGRGELQAVHGRHGVSDEPRGAGELGYAALRGGDVPGEHTVYFFGEGERIEITHRALTPDIFVRGAARAALWLIGKPAGRYGMADVLASPGA